MSRPSSPSAAHTSNVVLDMAHDDARKKRKRCFVTIGATAAFNSLIQAVLEPNFLRALHGAGYTDLRIQYGKEGLKVFEQKVGTKAAEIVRQYGIALSGFDFNQSGLDGEMKAAKGTTSDNGGTVISHAGSGSILDALRISIPLIVVPNTDLLHNHQVELAEVLAEQNYVVYGKLE
jgi:beta-1,4-N-acetylglucosaminyltransferase